MKMPANNFRRTTLLPLAAAAAALAGAFVAVPAQTTAPPMSAAQWQADVRFLGEELPKRHRNAFHRLKRAEFEAAVNALHDRIPQLSEDEILVGVMKLVALVRDGHTNVVPREFFRSGVFPLRLYRFSDGVFVQKAAPEHAALVGARVVKIGRASADEAFAAVGQAAFADNEMGVKALVPAMLTVPEILAGFKLIDDKGKLPLTIERDGRQTLVEIRATGALAHLFRPPDDWPDAAGRENRALYLKNPSNLYWFEHLKDRKTFYIQHNGIGNKPDEAVAAFYRRALAEAETGGAETLVVDLRFNGGGNNTLNRAVVIELVKSKLNRRGKFFVVIGRETFSAAQNLVNQIEKYTEATFVGEPTAAHPNHYGDNRPFTLPHSRLTVRASTLWWQDLDPRDARYWTAPEIAAEISSADYRHNVDPALEAIFAYRPGTTYADLVAEAQRGDLAAFVKKYREFKADARRRFVDTETEMNRFGYFLLEARRIDDAVTIFRLNAEFYPQSANVHDSLGEALLAAGKKEEAIKAYEKALAIDPTFPTAIEALKKLRTP